MQKAGNGDEAYNYCHEEFIVQIRGVRIMAKMLKPVPLTVIRDPRRIYLGTAVLYAMAITIFVVILLNTPLTIETLRSGDAGAIIVGLILVFGLIPMLIADTTRKARAYQRLLRILENITVEDDTLVVKGDVVIEAGRVLTYKYVGGYRYRNVRAKVVFHGEKTLEGNRIYLWDVAGPYVAVVNFSESEYYVDSPALRVRGEDGEAIIAVLSPAIPVPKDTTLSVSRDEEDYGYVTISRENNSYRISTRYVKSSSKELRLTVQVKGLPIVSDEYVVFRMREGGVGSETWQPYILDEIVLLPLPPVGLVYDYTGLYSHIKEKYPENEERIFIVGYEGANLKLVLDVPLRRDVVSETELSCQIIRQRY